MAEKGKGEACCNLGNVSGSLGDFRNSTDYGERSLQVTQEVGETTNETTAYGDIGDAYVNLSDFQRAIDYIERHLKIAREARDRVG